MLDLLAPLVTVVGAFTVIMAAALSTATKVILRRLFPSRLSFSERTLFRVAIAEALIMTGALIVTFIPVANHATTETGPRSTMVMIIVSVTVLHGLFACLPNRFLVRASGGDSGERHDSLLEPALLGLLTPLYLTSLVVVLYAW